MTLLAGGGGQEQADRFCGVEDAPSEITAEAQLRLNYGPGRWAAAT